MIDVQQRVVCVYCGGDAGLYDKNARHPFAPGIGSFNIYRCSSCSSLVTHPVPDTELSAALYASFDKGMHKKARELRTLFPLHGWFRQCLRHMTAGELIKGKEFSWIDIGAGEGEMSNLMIREFPGTHGTAIDFIERAAVLDPRVRWIRADLSNELLRVTEPADLVFAITVFEHMADPVQFIRYSLDLLKPGGVFYFNCPRADSNAFRLMGRQWPYYLPGEHVTIPSIRGLEKLMHRECRSKFGDQYQLEIKPVIFPYPLGFYLGQFLPFAKKLFPAGPDVYFPTGMLECKLHSKH